MNTIWQLTGYEWRKLWGRKMVLAAFALCLGIVVIASVVPLMGKVYIDGVEVGNAYQEDKIDQGYARALNGRAIDQGLLEEMVGAYRKVPLSEEKHYTGTWEYQKYARPYSPIFQIASGHRISSAEIFETWIPSEEDFYDRRQKMLERDWENLSLTEGEKAFWRSQEEQIPEPLVYQEHFAYDKLFGAFQTTALMGMLLVAVSLAGVFPEEHTRRMDQLTLSSRHGKERLYWAKILAGVLFALTTTLVLFGTNVLLTFALYGSQGFSAPFQLLYRFCSAPISAGQAMGIAYGCTLVTAVFLGILVMVLSELLRSGIATLGIFAALLMAGMVVQMPPALRTACQLWDWLPTNFISIWNIFGTYTLPFFRTHLTSWQAVPVLFLLLAIPTTLAGWIRYRRYQVSGKY